MDYVPVTRDQRRAVYAVSPAATEMRSALEDPANVWQAASCAHKPCDFPGGSFVWAMRDVAQRAGRMTSGRESQRFFGAIVDDIDDACGSVLRCSATGLGPLPPARRLDPGRIWTSSVGIAQYLLSYNAGEPERAFPSDGIEASWRTMLRPLRRVTPRSGRVRRRGGAQHATPGGGIGAHRSVPLDRADRRGPGVAGAGARSSRSCRSATARDHRARRRHVDGRLVADRAARRHRRDRFAIVFVPYVMPSVGFLLVFILLGCSLLATVIGELTQRRSSVGGRGRCSDTPEPASAA